MGSETIRAQIIGKFAPLSKKFLDLAFSIHTYIEKARTKILT